MTPAVHAAPRHLAGAASLRSRAPDPSASPSAGSAAESDGEVALAAAVAVDGAPAAPVRPWLAPSALQGRPAESGALPPAPADPALEAVVSEVQDNLAALAGDPDAFHAALTRAFGERHDGAAAEGIRRQVLAGDFSWMPAVRVLDRAALQDTSGIQGTGTALGAYDAAGDVVYLGRELVDRDPAGAAAILTEEVGHALDARLNTSDAAGDEGDIFARTVAGEEITAEELTALRAEDDSGTIVVDGREIEVEYGWFGRAVRSVGRAVSSAASAVGDAVSSAGRAVDRHVIQPVRGAIGDAVDIAANTAGSVVDVGKSLWRGGRDAFGAVLRGNFGGAWGAVTRAGGEIVGHAVGWGIETAAMLGHGVANFVDGVFGLSETRGLNASEVACLRTIYGDSLDYGAIRVQSGGVKSLFGGLDPHAVGNDIYLPEHYFAADGSLTPAGLELLSHEAAHSWQFQNGGAQYLSDAILSYIDDRSAAYDWRSALDETLPFDDMTPDQQAEFARLIGVAVARDPSGLGTFTRAGMDRATGRTLSDAQWSHVQGIRQRILEGRA